ncbi:MAG TPA: hypothetical protein VGQ33_23075, partial [Vicinamibacteria bacterium]|nr:hypothetical protein [Vicinamibacteria bacterium]
MSQQPEPQLEVLQKLVGDLAGKSHALSAELCEQVERLSRRARELAADLGAAQSLLAAAAAEPSSGHGTAGGNGNGNGNGTGPGNGNGHGGDESARSAADLERENREFARRCVQLEEHSANLANLYAATYQLHATLEPDAVVNCIVEISVNLIGAAEFALYLLEETRTEFALRVREGDLPPEITQLPEPVYPLEQAAVREKRTLFAVE